MGVLNCDRVGCDNIMCDYLSHRYGYICYECLQELREATFTDIESFMETPKQKGDYPSHLQEAWEKLLDEEFKERY